MIEPIIHLLVKRMAVLNDISVVFLIPPSKFWNNTENKTTASFHSLSNSLFSNRLYFPPRWPGFKPGSGRVGFSDGQKWCWGRVSPRTSVSPANLHSICFSTIIFTITRGWHNRPGVAAVPMASQFVFIIGF
jgi:hypothetical protein